MGRIPSVFISPVSSAMPSSLVAAMTILSPRLFRFTPPEYMHVRFSALHHKHFDPFSLCRCIYTRKQHRLRRAPRCVYVCISGEANVFENLTCSQVSFGQRRGPQPTLRRSSDFAHPASARNTSLSTSVLGMYPVTASTPPCGLRCRQSHLLHFGPGIVV